VRVVRRLVVQVALLPVRTAWIPRNTTIMLVRVETHQRVV
jgi:hypothetical protein